jgi:hypothetical protein
MRCASCRPQTPGRSEREYTRLRASMAELASENTRLSLALASAQQARINIRAQ